MATVRGYPWITIARVLALIALLLIILVVAVPGVPDWLLPLAVALLAIAILLG